MLLLERLGIAIANAAALRAGGAEAPHLVDPQVTLEELLAAEPAVAPDPERRELMDALGLSGG